MREGRLRAPSVLGQTLGANSDSLSIRIRQISNTTKGRSLNQ